MGPGVKTINRHGTLAVEAAWISVKATATLWETMAALTVQATDIVGWGSWAVAWIVECRLSRRATNTSVGWDSA